MKLNQDIIFALTVQALWIGGLVIVSYMAGFNAGRDSRRKDGVAPKKRDSESRKVRVSD